MLTNLQLAVEVNLDVGSLGTPRLKLRSYSTQLRTHFCSDCSGVPYRV